MATLTILPVTPASRSDSAPVEGRYGEPGVLNPAPTTLDQFRTVGLSDPRGAVDRSAHAP